jgi:hypothetical protein
MRRIIIVFSLTAAVMLFVFSAADWYATSSALPRYCAKPAETIAYVRKILTSQTPSAGQKKRPFVIAAKLIFLVPQADSEPTGAYLERLRRKISEICGQRF